MNDFASFLSKGAEFYLSAPAFFNWGAPLVVGIVGGLIWLAYWLGGKFAESENTGLKAQIAAIEQRFNLAKEQTVIFTKEIADLGAQLDNLKAKIANHAPLKELQDSTALLEGNIGRLQNANTAARGV